MAVEVCCLHWFFPASHRMRESSDFSSDPAQLPMLSSVLLATRSIPVDPTSLPLRDTCHLWGGRLLPLPPTCTWTGAVETPSRAMSLQRGIYNNQPVNLAWHSFSIPPLASHVPCSSVFYSTTPLFLFCNTLPGGFNTWPYIICDYSRIFRVKTLLLKPQWFMWFFSWCLPWTPISFSFTV